jgi:nitrite reductase/ring-hydroxylating ferredoxin subunit
MGKAAPDGRGSRIQYLSFTHRSIGPDYCYNYGELLVATHEVPAAVRVQAMEHGAVPYRSAEGAAYLVIYQAGEWRVFANLCPHRRLPLDRAGRLFFTADRSLLVCPNHGAKFHPLTGTCVAGPCVGKSLQRVLTLEQPDATPDLKPHP